MRVREATASDVSAIAAGMKLVVDEGRWLATQPSTTEAQLLSRFSRAVASGRTIVGVAEGDDGRIVGSVGLHGAEPPGVWSLGMWVLAGERGRGIGRRLIEFVFEQAEDHAIRKIELEVFVDNEAALALYSAVGFEREGVLRDHYEREDGTLRSAILMAYFPGARNAANRAEAT